MAERNDESGVEAAGAADGLRPACGLDFIAPKAGGALDALQGVAFIEGDANVAQVDEVAPGPHRGAARGVVAELLKGTFVLAVVAASLVFGLMGSTGDDFVSMLVALLAVLVSLVAVVVGAIVGWRVCTWELASDGLVLRSGVFVRKQRRIPYQRVHSVDLSASVLERLLGLVSVRVDTGAGESGEGNVVKRVKRNDGEALKRALFARRVLVDRRAAEVVPAASDAMPDKRRAAAPQDGTTGGAGRPGDAAAFANGDDDPTADIRYEMRLENRLHVISALTDFSIGAAFLSLFAALASVFQFASEVFGAFLMHAVESAIQSAVVDIAGLVDLSVGALLPMALIGLSVFVVTLLVVTWLISAVLAYVRWGGFVVRRRADRIEISSGLLSRSTRAVELGRVQSVHIDQSPLRRWLGYVQIAVRTVGSAAADSGDATSRERVVVHPCIPKAQAHAFLAQVLPEFADVAAVPTDELGLHRLSGAALRRTLLHGAYWVGVPAVVLGVVTFMASGMSFDGYVGAAAASAGLAFAWSLLAMCAVATFAVRVLAWRIRRAGTSGATLVMVDGGIGRRVTYVVRSKVQSLSVRVSPFQARACVATVSGRTACVSAEGDPKMRDVPARAASELAAWVRPHYDNAQEAHDALVEAGVLSG